MTSTQPSPRRSGARLFAASVWTALTTALLSALLPIGLPSSMAHGSAFNPATVAVSLKAPPSQARQAVRPARENAPEQVAPDGGMLLSGAVAPAPPSPVYSVLPSAPLTAPVLDQSVEAAAWPRAPPVI